MANYWAKTGQNINWDKIPKDAKVTDEGKWYTYNGMLVTWSSFDAVEAQRTLARMARTTTILWLAGRDNNATKKS